MTVQKRPRGATLHLRSGRAAERRYPESEVRGGDERSYPVSKVSGSGWEELPHAPKPEARGSSQEEQPTPKARGSDERSYPASKVRGHGREEIPHASSLRPGADRKSVV